AQPLETPAGPSATWNGQWQTVYLDFTSGTSNTAYTNAHGAHNYLPAERTAIQTRLEAAYIGPGGSANPWFHYKFTQTKPSSGAYTTLQFNQTPDNGQAGGQSKEIDFANLNKSALVVIDINGFLGGFGQPADTSDNAVALSSTIGEHE